MQIIIFENKDVPLLYPITLTRPTCQILCGGTTLYAALKKQFANATMRCLVPKHLKAMLARTDANDEKFAATSLLILNGSLVPSLELVAALEKKITNGISVIFEADGTIIGAYLDFAETNQATATIAKLTSSGMTSFLESLKFKREILDWPRLTRPWDIIEYNQQLLPDNLAQLSKDLKPTQDKVFLGSNVSMETGVVFDAAAGIIIVGDDTKIKAHAVLRGPLLIGKKCLVNCGAEIKGSSIGDVCKVGGEVEASIIQGYSNKQHYGFLGHSYIGEWVNLSAGTTNSDLKNTYGSVKMAGIDTGRQFLGCVIGDYTKSAINTAIFTGKVIGVNSFLYGWVTVDVPSFTNFIFCESSLIECPLAIAQKIQEKMLSRRDIVADESYRRLLADVFDLTAGERQQKKVRSGELLFNQP